MIFLYLPNISCEHPISGPIRPNALQALQNLPLRHCCNTTWPGNVRELRNVIDRAILLETTDKIGLSSLIFNPEQHIDGSTGPTIQQWQIFRSKKQKRNSSDVPCSRPDGKKPAPPPCLASPAQRFTPKSASTISKCLPQTKHLQPKRLPNMYFFQTCSFNIWHSSRPNIFLR